MTNNRFVVISTKTQRYQVFEGNKCLVEFVAESGYQVSAEEIEIIRTQEYKTRA